MSIHDRPLTEEERELETEGIRMGISTYHQCLIYANENSDIKNSKEIFVKCKKISAELLNVGDPSFVELPFNRRVIHEKLKQK